MTHAQRSHPPQGEDSDVQHRQTASGIFRKFNQHLSKRDMIWCTCVQALHYANSGRIFVFGTSLLFPKNIWDGCPACDAFVPCGFLPRCQLPQQSNLLEHVDVSLVMEDGLCPRPTILNSACTCRIVDSGVSFPSSSVPSHLLVAIWLARFLTRMPQGPFSLAACAILAVEVLRFSGPESAPVCSPDCWKKDLVEEPEKGSADLLGALVGLETSRMRSRSLRPGSGDVNGIPTRTHCLPRS